MANGNPTILNATENGEHLSFISTVGQAVRFGRGSGEADHAE